MTLANVSWLPTISAALRNPVQDRGGVELRQLPLFYFRNDVPLLPHLISLHHRLRLVEIVFIHQAFTYSSSSSRSIC